MKLLSSNETKNISGGAVAVTIQGTEINIHLDRSENFSLVGFGIPEGLFFRSDGKVFNRGQYIEIAEKPQVVYNINGDFTISKLTSLSGFHFKITPL